VVNSDATFKEPRRVKPSYLYPNGSDPAKDQQKIYNFRMSNKPNFVVGTHKETTSNGLFGASKFENRKSKSSRPYGRGGFIGDRGCRGGRGGYNNSTNRTSVSTGVGKYPITTDTEPKISTPRMPNFTSRTTKTPKRILSPTDENCGNSAKIAAIDDEDTSLNEELQ
ncbi:unnamed protein product, partial [Brachionus calyciflorus]